MFTLPPLPYSLNALEPYLSEKQMELHYYRHHQNYINKLNDIVKHNPLGYQSLEEIIKYGANFPPNNLYNNAAQHYNHSFYWKSMTTHHSIPSSNAINLSYSLTKTFGSMNTFAELFISEAKKYFGSGWIWLVWDGEDNKLHLMTTHDAGCPLGCNKLVPLFNCDLWEHAYYYDYQNEKDRYLKAFISNLVNWEFASKNFENRLPKVENGKSFFNS